MAGDDVRGTLSQPLDPHLTPKDEKPLKPTLTMTNNSHIAVETSIQSQQASLESPVLTQETSHGDQSQGGSTVSSYVTEPGDVSSVASVVTEATGGTPVGSYMVDAGGTVLPGGMGLSLDPASASMLPFMNLASLQGAGLLPGGGLTLPAGALPVLQGFPGMSSGAGTTGIPMMIQAQGIGGSGPVTFIYPFPSSVMSTTAPSSAVETSTVDSTASPTAAGGMTVVTSSGQSLSSLPGVITVAPQPDNEGATDLPAQTVEISTQPAVVSQPISIGGQPLTVPGGGLVDMKALFSSMGNSLQSAITNQIIMGIKSEASSPPVPPVIDEPTSPGDPLTPTDLPCDHASMASPYNESHGASKAKRPKMSSLPPVKEEKICKVCGDRALGCNFDAISCESCKAFFRRNALKEKQPKCLFEGSCKIDLNTRRFCPFCRLQKCFTIGMKKELILREDEKRKRNIKVAENREKRYVKGGKGMPSLASPTTPGPPTPGPPTPGPSTPLTPSVHEDEAQEVYSEPPDSPKPEPAAEPPSEPTSLIAGMGLTLGGMSFSVAGSGITNVNPTSVTSSPDVTNLLSLSRFAQKGEISSNVQLDTYLVRRLTAEENHMLQELMQVYDLSFTVDLEPLIHIKHLDPSLNQLVNQSSITVLRLIKFAKRLEEFIRLTQECQIGILKGTWIHILLLRSVSLYDSERDVWVTPKGDIPTEILKNATGFVKLHDDHVRYCKSIKNIIRDDLMIVVILLVIVLFSPEGPNVINRELVSNIQDKYLVLLKHYLESKYTYVRAADMFPALMSKLKELKELAEIHGKYLLDVNPSEIEPIMLEILDLK